MRSLSMRVLAISTITIAAGALAVPAAAAPGPGTFTRITTPAGALIYHFNGNSGATNTLHIAGFASNDVTSVDIDCINHNVDGSLEVNNLGAIPVTGGSFGGTLPLANFPTSCRLRAVPTGYATSEYLGSFAGPILYANVLAPSIDAGSSRPYAYEAIAEEGDGFAATLDAGSCGTVIVATISVPSMTVAGDPNELCALALPRGNQTASGTPTGSSIKVSGHNAYLPSAVHQYLRGTLTLTLTQSRLTYVFTRYPNGDLRIVESAPLVRCSVSDLYPPTAASCPALVSAGVTFRRVADLFRGAHQVRYRDTYISTDGARHPVSLQYQTALSPPHTGALGFSYPGHSSAFGGSAPDQTVTGFGRRAGTLYIRTDRYAAADETNADTYGLTWSRPPAKVTFSHSSRGSFATPYSLTVPAHGIGFLGFAFSEHVTVAPTKALAGVAEREMVAVPVISSPHNRATVKGHAVTVRGSLAAGANGLPTKVVVAGHLAGITRRSNGRATYQVRFAEPYGWHTIRVTAYDLAGNARASSIRVRTKP